MRELSKLEIEAVSGAGPAEWWDSLCNSISSAFDSVWDSVSGFFSSGGGGDASMACDFLPSGGQICANSAETVKYKQALDEYAICEATGEGDCVLPEAPNYKK